MVDYCWSEIRLSFVTEYVSGDDTVYSTRPFFSVFAKHDVSFSILLTDVDTMYISEIGEVLNMKKLGVFFAT